MTQGAGIVFETSLGVGFELVMACKGVSSGEGQCALLRWVADHWPGRRELHPGLRGAKAEKICAS